MNKKLTGPSSTSRVIGLSQKHFAAGAKTRSAIENAVATISDEALRQCRGGLLPLLVK